MAEYINLDDMLEQFDKRASKLVGDRRISVESMREFIVNRFTMATPIISHSISLFPMSVYNFFYIGFWSITDKVAHRFN